MKKFIFIILLVLVLGGLFFGKAREIYAACPWPYWSDPTGTLCCRIIAPPESCDTALGEWAVGPSCCINNPDAPAPPPAPEPEPPAPAPEPEPEPEPGPEPGPGPEPEPGPGPEPEPEEGIRFESPIRTTDFDEMLTRVLSWVWPISGAIAVLMIIIGAYYMVLSGGNPEKIVTGRKIIIYALVGFGIVTIATGIVALIRQILGL